MDYCCKRTLRTRLKNSVFLNFSTFPLRRRRRRRRRRRQPVAIRTFYSESKKMILQLLLPLLLTLAKTRFMKICYTSESTTTSTTTMGRILLCSGGHGVL